MMFLLMCDEEITSRKWRAVMHVLTLIEKTAKRSCVLTHAIQHFAGAVKYTLRSPTRGQHCQKRECVNYLFHAALSCFCSFVLNHVPLFAKGFEAFRLGIRPSGAIASDIGALWVGG